ncbi:MAG: protein-L-isoaspartate O-methyltransferase [Gammaproteobacteria bacterium]|nr:protein-L-isoaspartate O-methyltransferase [Gammaproteobacteria bacterium]
MAKNENNARFNMLEQQVRPSDVLNPRVLDAFDKIDRKLFVEDYLVGLAYADTALPIGFGQVMLSPVTQGRMLQALDVKTHETVLEIGTGNGYFTALLAQLAQQVISVEIVPELSVGAQQCFEKRNINNVTFAIGDASKAWVLPDRVDVIVITAAFVLVPEAYFHALKVGGRMLAVVGEATMMTAQLITRVSEREWQTQSMFETVIPPMVNAEPQPEFEF